jgi:hypothetical protein
MDFFRVANQWDSVPDSEKQRLKDWIRDLVGYTCKIACRKNHGVVDIYVFSEARQAVTDWLELQATGAIGVSFDMYEDPDSDAVDRLHNRCENYNDQHDVEFASDSESESGDSESDTEEDGESSEPKRSDEESE